MVVPSLRTEKSIYPQPNLGASFGARIIFGCIYCATAFQLAARVNEIAERHASNFPADGVPNEFRGTRAQERSSRRGEGPSLSLSLCDGMWRSAKNALTEEGGLRSPPVSYRAPFPNIRNSRAESNLDPRSRGPRESTTSPSFAGPSSPSR